MVSIKNKVLIKLCVPEIDKEYDIFIPINKKVGNVIILLNQAVSELSNGEFPLSNTNTLCNKITKELYNPDDLVLYTNIRNGSILVLTS